MRKRSGNVYETFRVSFRQAVQGKPRTGRGNVLETVRKRLRNVQETVGNVPETFRERLGNGQETVRKRQGNG